MDMTRVSPANLRAELHSCSSDLVRASGQKNPAPADKTFTATIAAGWRRRVTTSLRPNELQSISNAGLGTHRFSSSLHSVRKSALESWPRCPRSAPATGRGEPSIRRRNMRLQCNLRPPVHSGEMRRFEVRAPGHPDFSLRAERCELSSQGTGALRVGGGLVWGVRTPAGMKPAARGGGTVQNFSATTIGWMFAGSITLSVTRRPADSSRARSCFSPRRWWRRPKTRARNRPPP